MTVLKHFTHKELQSKDNGMVFLNPEFAIQIELLREAWGKPMTPNSCCRSEQYNKDVGGVTNSYHRYDVEGRDGGTLAMDVHFPNGSDKMDFITLAWSMGWTVGIYKTFVHIDFRQAVGKPKAMFTG